jgi:alkylresorcinol/alkylpyrone synthase
MTHPAILGLAVATPAYQHAQMELYDRWLAPYIKSQRARAIFAAAQIDTRYSVLATSDFLANEPGTKARNDAYMQAARPLALETINRALAQAGLTPPGINHFIVISCTGFDTPGLDVILAAELGLRPDLRRSALIGMGCQAGLTGLDRASLEIAARPQSNVLLLALEFGTLHFQHGGSVANMVASAIFGDGLAAAVIGPGSPNDNQPRLLQTMTYSDYNFQELMGFHLSDTGYQIHLSTRVPNVLQDMLPALVEEFLKQAGLTMADIKFWGIHPGGAKIVDYIAQALALPAAALVYTRHVLRRYGNMSSAAIFFVLEAISQQGRPQAGDYALLLSFGPGLTIELGLVKW